MRHARRQFEAKAKVRWGLAGPSSDGVGLRCAAVKRRIALHAGKHCRVITEQVGFGLARVEAALPILIGPHGQAQIER